MKKISDLVNRYKEEIITIRREFHEYPELGFKEIQTAKKIAKYLNSWGYEVKTNIGKTGVVGLLRSLKSSKTIGIRADIDALPVKERTGLSFASKRNGVMHACGHDGHIAISLGTAKILSELKEEVPGNIKFIFQPAEETLNGAKAMISEGVLKDPPLNAIIGIHIMPFLESGTFGIRRGVIMASADKFEILIKGKGGHGAMPHKTVDPIVIASEIIMALQKIISREIDPLEPAIISVGTIHAGTAFNIIPDEVVISGTVRTFNNKVAKYISERMKNITSSITNAFLGDYEFNYITGVPVTINDVTFTNFVEKVLKHKFGEESVIHVKPQCGSEDFSLFLEKVPGTFFFLGTKNKNKSIVNSIHCSRYTIDEDVLVLGVQAFCEIVFGYFNINISGGIDEKKI